MRVYVRVLVLALLTGVLAAAFASAAQAVEVAEEPLFVAVNCKVETCAQSVTKINLGAPFGEQAYVEPVKPDAEEAEEEGYLQAGGRVPYGVTDFKVATTGSLPFAKPTAVVEHIRTDVAPGLATNPTAVAECSSEDFVETEPLPGSGFYPEPTCATSGSEDTKVGEQHATVFVETNKETGEGVDLALEGTVYNLKPKEGLASEYGVALKLPLAVTAGALKNEYFPYLESIGKAPSKVVQEFAEGQEYYAHTLIEGNVEWGKQARGTEAGDYHDYFEINVSPALPLVSSRLDFEGTNGTGDFVTNATSCPGHNTTTLKLTDKGGAAVKEEYTTPVGLMGCNGETDKFGTKFERLLFEPKFTLTGASAASDEPDELTTEASEPSDPTANSQSQVKTASITLPEGMTLNPSAAAGLEACTASEARIHGEEFGTACPASSEIGTVSLNVPTLPNGSLTGAVYLGASKSAEPSKAAEESESSKVTGGPPYIIYVVANSVRYGVSVRLKAEVVPNEATGQVTTIFNENPEQPFTGLAMNFNRGALTAVANPLVCGESQGTYAFTPTSGHPASEGSSFAFSTTGCASSIPFALTQSTSNQTSNAGAHTSFTFNLGRANGQQYLSKVSTTLPEGLVGEIPAVKQCGETEANAGTCSSETEIGTATVLAGSGPTPYTFPGHVYLTGPYDGAPYGMSIVVPANAGPFELGNVVTRATININPETTRVTIASTLPTIYKGIPLRVRNISIAVTKQGFMLNPTNCTTPLATESTLTSTMGATQSLSSAFPVTNCGAIAFKPTFAAKTSAKTSKANGASLETTLNLPLGDGNVKSALVQLPLELPSRLTTLQKACTEAVFAANPYSCPAGSFVGGARANTPVLPDKLSGPAILVSHGGEAFPDLDLVLEADNVRVILVGHTKITKGITTTDFSTTPDAPVTSITVSLPVGSHSALTNYGQLCPKPLVMPTTITGQNGVVFKQNTIIKVAGCSVRVVGHKVVGNTAYITVQTFAAGRVSGSGKSLSTAYARFNRARKTATLKVSLSGRGRHRGRPFKVKLRVGFLPKQKGLPASASFATLRFR
jgi:hypothetical protein